MRSPKAGLPATEISVDARLAGTHRSRFLLELFGNSAHFPIANILLEMLLEGPGAIAESNVS